MSETLIKPAAGKSPARAKLDEIRRKRRKATGSGIVSYIVNGSLEKKTGNGEMGANLVRILEGGLPVNELDVLQKSLAISTEKLAEMVGISKATFHRYKGAGSKLELGTADRVVRFARLMGKAAKVFGDPENARKWLKSPQVGLGGGVPLNYAKSEVGAREVENLLGRIEYGVYS